MNTTAIDQSQRFHELADFLLDQEKLMKHHDVSRCHRAFDAAILIARYANHESSTTRLDTAYRLLRGTGYSSDFLPPTYGDISAAEDVAYLIIREIRTARGQQTPRSGSGQSQHETEDKFEERPESSLGALIRRIARLFRN